MTDKTTELRRLLDERGAEYEKSEDDTTIYYDSGCNRYTYNVNPDSGWAQLFGYNLTPEQAIVATLADDDYELKMDALLCRLTNGKFSKSRAYDLDFMESCVNEEFEILYADELNAALGGGTCEQVITDCDDGLMPPFTAHCSTCGAEWGFTPKFCHNCGAKVTGTRDERKAVKR